MRKTAFEQIEELIQQTTVSIVMRKDLKTKKRVIKLLVQAKELLLEAYSKQSLEG